MDGAWQRGTFNPDKKCRVKIAMVQVVGFHLFCAVPSTIHSLGFRTIIEGTEFPPRLFDVRAGDIELGLEDVYGTGGTILARSARIDFVPTKDSK